MRNRLRAGIFIGAVLLAPMAVAIPASAVPLQSVESVEQVGPVANPGCPGGAPHWGCLLSSLSAGISS
ncbi:hypothetical protein HLB23_25050 [Nocardia uniformis]|uniref:Uncharacterized protein n=1 Tax=Nocardia uniformis TaxID=53432 RepID=A0A849CD95_9NOCA|nr:hypothetical protein [Nocardia uniformis]NNH73089.1 hypothetical protein [Nocardia uniformis]